MDPRGEEDISFTVYHDLDIINNSYCTANFDSHQGESWIDLLLIRKCAHRITDWTIHDWVTLSDFNVMYSIYQGRSRNLHPRDVRRRCRPRSWFGMTSSAICGQRIWTYMITTLRTQELKTLNQLCCGCVRITGSVVLPSVETRVGRLRSQKARYRECVH